jgi:predicted nucleotidyltransferase
MIINKPLDEIFRTWSHVAVLRILRYTKNGFSGNEIARQANMNPRSALIALTSLEKLGLVQRQRGGREHIFTLNTNNFLVKNSILPLLKSEKDFQTSLISSIAKNFNKKVLSCYLFGSVVDGSESIESDLDIFFIVNDQGQKLECEKVIDRLSPFFRENFYVKISSMILTRSELRIKFRTNKKFFEDLLINGIKLFGINIKDFLSEKTTRNKKRRSS